MWRSMADEVEEIGRKKGELQSRRQILERQLRERFGRVPRSMVQIIRETTDIARLDTWLKAFARAETLADVGITAATET